MPLAHDAMETSALHQAMRWGARALDFVESETIAVSVD